MKKVFLVISALALIAGVFESCKKEEQGGSGGGESSKFTFTATIADNDTKVSYSEVDGDLKPKWAGDDKVIGFDSKGITYTFKVKKIDSEGAATFERVTSGTGIGTAKADPANGRKMYIFYAPTKKAEEIADNSLSVDISSQTAGGYGSHVPALMMASGTVKNNKLTLRFENKTAIIGIKKPTIPSASTTTSITLSGTGINTKVKFSLDIKDNDTTLVASYDSPGTITKSVSSSSVADSTTYIVACPLETAAELTFKTNNNESFSKSGRTMSAGNYYYMTPTFNKPVLLPGEFSVSATKTVKFTSGNLYWDGTQYKFETNQTDYPDSWDANHVGHFFWSKTASVAYAQEYSESQSTSDTFFFDEGNSIAIGGKTGYYALSSDEWVYLITTRGTSLRKYGVTVGGKSHCLVIAPDGFTDELKSSYTLDELNSAGLVCLYAAGFRTDSGICNQGNYGAYWSSTLTDYTTTQAHHLGFFIDSVSPGDAHSRGKGSAIRLVKTESEVKYPGTDEPPIKIGNTIWSPVNCGYDATHPYGSLYQWGRKFGQPYELGNITPTTDMSKSDDNEDNKDKHGTNLTNYNWFYDAVDNELWNGTTRGTKDPCPSGWRVPAYEELSSLIANKSNWTSKADQNGYYFSGGIEYTESVPSVFLPAAGSRYCTSGETAYRGIIGYYWSSSVFDKVRYAYELYFDQDGEANLIEGNRSFGHSVRCVKE